MTAVFLDTVGLLALWDTTDQWHAVAESAFAELRRANALLTTTWPEDEARAAASAVALDFKKPFFANPA